MLSYRSLIALFIFPLGVGIFLYSQHPTNSNIRLYANVKESTNHNILINDNFLDKAWGIQETRASQAWQITEGSREIVVAVIDTGVGEHKNLQSNLWLNPKEVGVVDSEFCREKEEPLKLAECDKSRNGKDDSGNGKVDDVHGWNFVSNNNDLRDNHNHGTHIAGIIGAQQTEDGFGITGVAPRVSLMILKYYDPQVPGGDNLKNTIKAIRYAVDNGAHIINYSGGGMEFSSKELSELRRAQEKGILVVAAAGNERSNSDELGRHYYPANYALDNVISVTAIRQSDHSVLESSNFGEVTVHLAAPGHQIYSTLPGNRFGRMTGTSQATAFVSGVAALMLAHRPHFNYRQVKEHLLQTGTEHPNLVTKTGTARILNAYRALTRLDATVNVAGSSETSTSQSFSQAAALDEDTSLSGFRQQLNSLLSRNTTAKNED